jgi:hypothetical protein
MTRWGALLIVAFVALGLSSRVQTSVAMRTAGFLAGGLLIAVWFTAW